MSQSSRWWRTPLGSQAQSSQPIRGSKPNVWGRQTSQSGPVTRGGHTHWPVRASHRPLAHWHPNITQHSNISDVLLWNFNFLFSSHEGTSVPIQLFLLTSAPSLGVNYWQQLTLPVCPDVFVSRPFKLLLLFCFLMESSHFWAVSSPCGTLQNVVLRFLI